MKTEIRERKDIDNLVKLFYDKLFEDELLNIIFEKLVRKNLEAHLSIVADFWDSILLDANNYRGNVTEKHFDLNKQFPLSKTEFDRWLQLWKQSVDELFFGEKAEIAKFRAQSIADIMQYKLEYITQQNKLHS